MVKNSLCVCKKLRKSIIEYQTSVDDTFEMIRRYHERNYRLQDTMINYIEIIYKKRLINSTVWFFIILGVFISFRIILSNLVQ